MQESIRHLKTAIEELSIFTASHSSHLKLGKNGRLTAEKSGLLNQIVGFARPFLGLPSDQEGREPEKRLQQLKERILRLREIIQTHYPLIESFQKGTESQRKFAAFALTTIQCYNDLVIGKVPSTIKRGSFYEEERRRLLLDQEIKGHPIATPAQQILKRLNQSIVLRETLSNAVNPIYKKNSQFIIDVFRVKTRNFFRENSRFAEGEIELKEEQETGRIIVEQQIKDLDSGSVSVLSACFQLPHSLGSKLPIPTLLELKLNVPTV